MIIFKKAAEVSAFLSGKQKQGIVAGFVPTMGALHKGHISLITKAKTQTDLIVCSIFVNPTQFNDPKDFEKYPVTIEQDVHMLESAGCNVLFLPSVDEMYPHGLQTSHQYELGFLETILDGKYRPGHFQGVCQVVDRLLQIVLPDKLFLGQKDLQQFMVLQKMASVRYPTVQLVMCPIEREADGLAMSSRNVRLNKEERQVAVAISATLTFIKHNVAAGDLTGIKELATQQLTEKGFKVDYVEVANAHTLQLLENWDGEEIIAVLAAAFLHDVRLIDNMILNG